MPLIHAGLSLYLFDCPRFDLNVNIIHMYIGYAVLLAILISQSLFGAGAIYTIMTSVMYVLIAVHIIFGTRSWLQRRSAQDQMSQHHRAVRNAN